MKTRLAALALFATLAVPAAHASPKNFAIHLSMPGLSITYADPGFRVSVPVYAAPPSYAPAYSYPGPAYHPAVPAYVYPAPVYAYPAPTYVYSYPAPAYRPAYPAHVHHGHGHRGQWQAGTGHQEYRGSRQHGHPGRHGHDGHRGHWR